MQNTDKKETPAADDTYDIDIYTFADENGKEADFELVKRMKVNGQEYAALTPYSEAETETETFEFVILKIITENGEEVFVMPDDEQEYEAVCKAFGEAFEKEFNGLI
jgi:uncharacterized protein YrzB (UPF0473 family)